MEIFIHIFIILHIYFALAYVSVLQHHVILLRDCRAFVWTRVGGSSRSWPEVQEFVERSCFIPSERATLRRGRESEAFAFRKALAESGVITARCCEVMLYSGLMQAL